MPAIFAIALALSFFSPVLGTETPAKTVVFLGDSLTAGLGVQPSEAFPALIAEKIRAGGLPFEVQNAGLSGDTSAAVKLNAPSVKFTIDNGRARHEPYAITLNDQSVMIAGETEMNGGKLAMQARLVLSPQMQKEGFGEAIVVPISGTVEQPKMEVNSIASNISPGS